MEAEPRMDASRPSNLRLAGFVLTAAGALAMGVGSLLTWVTVGIADAAGIATVSPGTDLAAGVFTLICAVVILVVVIMSRMVRERTRTALAIVVIVAGTLSTLLAAWFIKAAPDYYSPVDDEKLVAALAAAYGRTADAVRVALTNVIDELGGYTHVGLGPWIVIVGGILTIVGGVLTLRWARSLRTPKGAGEPTPFEIQPTSGA